MHNDETRWQRIERLSRYLDRLIAFGDEETDGEVPANEEIERVEAELQQLGVSHHFVDPRCF